MATGDSAARTEPPAQQGGLHAQSPSCRGLRRTQSEPLTSQVEKLRPSRRMYRMGREGGRRRTCPQVSSGGQTALLSSQSHPHLHMACTCDTHTCNTHLRHALTHTYTSHCHTHTHMCTFQCILHHTLTDTLTHPHTHPPTHTHSPTLLKFILLATLNA